MNGVICFDSIHGNTRLVAELMAIEMMSKGHRVRLVDLAQGESYEGGADFLFLGCPNRMKRISSMAKRFLRRMDHDAWMGKRVIVFDTILEVKDDPNKTAKQNAKARKWSLEGAAPKMKAKLEKKGIKCEDLWHYEVSGLHGPLVIGWEEKVKQSVVRF